MAFVTGAEIIEHVRKAGSATPIDEAWADTCAASIEALIAKRMEDVTVADPGPIASALRRAALQDGAAAYVDRDAPHGVQSLGPDGQAVRVGRSESRALEPVFARYAGPGIG